MKKIALIMFLFVANYNTAFALEKLPQFPFPNDERVVVVSDYMIFNGVPMSAYKINSIKSVEEFLDFYKNKWSGTRGNGMPGYKIVEDEDAGIVLMSRLEDGAMYTVQVNTTSLNELDVTLGVSLIPSVSSFPELGKGFPLMGKSTVINDIINIDNGVKARTLLIEISGSAYTVKNFYQGRIKSLGWSQAKPSPSSNYDKNAKDDHVLFFYKDDQEMQIVIVRKSRSETVATVLITGLK